MGLDDHPRGEARHILVGRQFHGDRVAHPRGAMGLGDHPRGATPGLTPSFKVFLEIP